MDDLDSDGDSNNENNIYESRKVCHETDTSNETDKDVVKFCDICIWNQKKQTSEWMIPGDIAVYPFQTGGNKFLLLKWSNPFLLIVKYLISTGD